MSKTLVQKTPSKLVPLNKFAQKQLAGGAKAKTDKQTCDDVGGKYDSKTSICTY